MTERVQFAALSLPRKRRQDKWVFMLLKAGATIRNLGDVKWLATEDGTPGKGPAKREPANDQAERRWKGQT